MERNGRMRFIAQYIQPCKVSAGNLTPKRNYTSATNENTELKAPP
jgi:hypothetical protein